MALRKIALQGEPCLTKVCRPVTDFNGRLHTLLDDLADTLADSGKNTRRPKLRPSCRRRCWR